MTDSGGYQYSSDTMKANMSNSFDDELSWPSEHESIFGPAGLFPLKFLNPSGLDD